ncbi:MAG: bifunctional 2-polyprenyl-6-hydroxyphenol methylase/3-demethylubiquinol 3-O-methyltransferase UbiG, partial [Gammaproteobacteria bacterium]
AMMHNDNAVFGRGGWWDDDGEYKMLHAINPLRLRALGDITGGIGGKQLADVGCGGGIFAEAAAKAGAMVTAVDTNAAAVDDAKQHCQTTANYRAANAAELPRGHYDIAVCFEVLEHCDSPAALVGDVAALVKPGGWVAFSTINRTKRAAFVMIDLLEKTLSAMPRGAHNASRFIKPDELARYCNDAGLTVRAVKGLRYSFFGKHFYLDDSRFGINYFLFARRENS